MAEYLMEIPVGKRNYTVTTRTPEVSEKELEKYPFVDWLKEKLGDNFLGDLLYGSAARTDDPSKFSDYDNWVRVKDVKKAHEVLRGTKPAVVDGKLIENCPEDTPGWRHVGIHLFPEDDDYLLRHIRFLHDSVEFRKHTKVLYGEFPFPKVGMDEVIERGISHAYVKLKTIAGSLNWAWSSPERIIGKPNLYEFIVKNLKFFLQHSLNAVSTPRFRDKEELTRLLADRDLEIPKYIPDLDHIKDSLLYSMVSVLKLQKELSEHEREPRLDFMVDKEFKNVKDDTWIDDF
jgi:predicted nucleotidyltransferase